MKSALVIILLLGVALFFFLDSEGEKLGSEESESLGKESVVESGELTSLGSGREGHSVLPPRYRQADHRLQNDPTDWEQLPEEAKMLEDLKLPEQTAMNALFVLIQSCGRIANEGFMPTGLNVDVVNGLLGDNYRKIAYLPSDHPRINEVGEFVDGWKTPYEFHFQSSKNVEIRSAGPDLEMYSADDVLLELD